MCLCYLFSAKTARQLVNRKADFLQDESTRVDSHNESNRIESNRELECCSAERADRSAPIRTPARSRMHAGSAPGVAPALQINIHRRMCRGRWSNGARYGSSCHSPAWDDTTRYDKKGKVFPYSLPSVGPGADPGVQAVSPQVT